MFSYKFGKLAPKFDSRTLQMSDYITKLPEPPELIDWGSKVKAKWPMDKNDSVGDCTIAGAAHLIQLWSTWNGSPVIATDNQVIKAYSAVTGIEGAAYNPITGENDNGCNELDVLKYWNKVGIANQKIHAFVFVDPKNVNHVKIATDYFGGLYLGFQVPMFIQGFEEPGSTWDIQDTNTSIEGGHCVPVVGYDQDKLTVISWGARYFMTWAFFAQYCEESWAVLSEEWTGVNNAPSGFNLEQLNKDLRDVQSPVPQQG